jgi:hypothetical protein
VKEKKKRRKWEMVNAEEEPILRDLRDYSCTKSYPKIGGNGYGKEGCKSYWIGNRVYEGV